MFLVTLSIIGIVLVGCTFVAGMRAVWYGFRAVSLGKIAVPASRVREAPHKRVLVVGDSTAVGVGASSPAHSLVGRLITDYPHLHINNYAQNAIGFCALPETLSRISNTSYDLIILILGGMDVLRHTPHARISQAIADIHEHTDRLKAKSTVLISMNNVGNAPMWMYPLNTYFDARSRLLTEHLATLATKHGILHVPLYRAREHDPFAKNPDTYFAHDGTHPNDDGYALWYTHIQPIIHPHLTYD